MLRFQHVLCLLPLHLSFLCQHCSHCEPHIPIALLLLLLLLLLQVYFSRDFVHSLVQLPDGHLRARVLQQLHNLARGRRPARMFCSNAVAEHYQGIIQVLQVEELCLVWMVDADRSTCTQVGRTSALLSKGR
jgi:hypothetical protein